MNQLKVSIQQSIIVLTTRGWSRRRIARELGVDRATVGRQLRRAKAEANAATNPALGSGGVAAGDFVKVGDGLGEEVTEGGKGGGVPVVGVVAQAGSGRGGDLYHRPQGERPVGFREKSTRGGLWRLCGALAQTKRREQFDRAVQDRDAAAD